MRKAEVKRPLEAMVESVVLPLEYKKQKGSEGNVYQKLTSYGYVEISPSIWQHGTLFYVSFAIRIRISAINDITNPFINIIETSYEVSDTIAASINSFGINEEGKLRVETPEELANAVEILAKSLKGAGLEFIGRFQSVESVDKEMNRENRPCDLYCSEIRGRPFKGLTAAVLNNNPRSKYWENYYREQLRNANQHIKNQYEKLVAYLKANYAGRL